MTLVRGHGMLWQHILAAVVVTVLTTLAVWGRVPPVIVYSSELQPYRVQPGGMITVSRELGWLRGDCSEAFVSGVLIDSLNIAHVFDAKFTGRPHQLSSISRQWAVPFAMPWGPTVYREWVTFYCFPFYDHWPLVIEPKDLSLVIVKPD